MYDELTEVDIRKMREEIDYRTRVLRPKLIEDVQTARAFGDLSENFEYKCAKQEKNRNESRIRYLERMIKTAQIVEDDSTEQEVGLNDTVKVWFEEEDCEEEYKIVTTVRSDARNHMISIESPVGKALMKHKAGDRVKVEVNAGAGYYIQIREIRKSDDESEQIRKF